MGLKFLLELWNLSRVLRKRIFLKYLLSALKNIPQLVEEKSLNVIDKNFTNEKNIQLKINSENEVIIPLNYFSNAREIIARGVYFSLPGFKINRSDTCIDLGANTGIFTLVAAALGKNVIALEAQSEFIPIALSILKMNNLYEKAKIIHGIVGSKTGIFSDPNVMLRSSHFKIPPNEYTMTQIFNEYKIERCNFLKIDIEGSEFDLFSLNLDWLTRVDKIVLEVHCEYGNPQEIKNYLQQNMFQVAFVNNDKKIVNSINQKSGYIYGFKS